MVELRFLVSRILQHNARVLVGRARLDSRWEKRSASDLCSAGFGPRSRGGTLRSSAVEAIVMFKLGVLMREFSGRPPSSAQPNSKTQRFQGRKGRSIARSRPEAKSDPKRRKRKAKKRRSSRMWTWQRR